MREKLKNKKGITLIALVITIIVLLILAGVTIATLTGENGILTKATESKERTTQAKAEEMVSVAIGGLQTANLGDTSKITPEAIANQVMKDNNIENVVAEGSTFPTNIIFQDDGVKVGVDIDLSIGDNGSYDGIYSEEGLEGKIAPEDLFDYEIIDDGTVAATGMDNLPEKTVRITGIKPIYRQSNEDTHYGIEYDNDIIMNEKLLVIPYQVDGKEIPDGIEGEKYKVTEVSLKFDSGDIWGHGSLPNVKTIVYPNTVERLYADGAGNSFPDETIIERIILSNNLKEIDGAVFEPCPILKNITYKAVKYTSKSQLKDALKVNEVNITDEYSLFGFGDSGLSD